MRAWRRMMGRPRSGPGFTLVQLGCYSARGSIVLAVPATFPEESSFVYSAAREYLDWVLLRDQFVYGKTLVYNSRDNANSDFGSKR